MNIKYILISITAFFISACSSMTYTTKQESSEKNKPLINEIKCLTISGCEAKAAELCADGYNILSSSESVPYVLNKMEISCKTKIPPVVEKKEDSKLNDAIIEIEKEMKNIKK